MQREMKTVLSRIWTWFRDSISPNDNYHRKHPWKIVQWEALRDLFLFLTHKFSLYMLQPSVTLILVLVKLLLTNMIMLLWTSP